MFGWLGKLKRTRDDDFDDIRSTVLGERPFEPPQPMDRAKPFGPPQPAFPAFQSRGYEELSPRTREAFEPMDVPSFPASFEKPPEQINRSYEIVDRLNIIESQLVAVRSMTETINESLKNMEARMGLQRRY